MRWQREIVLITSRQRREDQHKLYELTCQGYLQGVIVVANIVGALEFIAL